MLGESLHARVRDLDEPLGSAAALGIGPPILLTR
jgi:hypothetical protein